MSHQAFEIETEEYGPQANGWEMETAVGASFTWECDRMQDAEVEQEGDLYFNQPASTHDSVTSDVDPEVDENRDITLMQLQEEIGLKTTLEMRELPDLTHGFATWNVCNGFEADKIAGIMLRCNLSILTIQEPRSTFNEIEVGFSKKVLLQHGIKGFFKKHQYFLFNERALGARVSKWKGD
jgi:hypothetical protein